MTGISPGNEDGQVRSRSAVIDAPLLLISRATASRLPLIAKPFYVLPQSMRWLLLIGFLTTGCMAQPEQNVRATEAASVTIYYAPHFGVSTTVSIPCGAFPISVGLKDTTITDGSLREKIEQYATEARFLNQSASLTHVDARKWVILEATDSETDTLCLGDLWGLEREGQLLGFADSLVVLINGLVYGPDVARQRRLR